MTQARLSVVYATDEHLLIRAAGDFTVLCPDWQKLAAGSDGVTGASGSDPLSTPWSLVSASVNFEANGVRPGHVIVLRRPASLFPGSGEPFAIERVSGHRLELRRPGQLAGFGQPVPAAVDIGFLITTLDPQIEEASFDLNRRFSIDPDIPSRSPEAVHDPRDLRAACVLGVLAQRYTAESRGTAGDFQLKLARVTQELSEVLGRLQIRWGKSGDGSPPSTWFSTRIVR